ncbi:MAG: helix-turn-helix transcriptional regulator [Mycobacteriales bacterium]
MSRRKTERLMNLVIALLATRTGISAGQIRERVPGYADDDVAFKRMFERDKEELRELGVPLETTIDWEGDPVYRVTRRDYELPEISLAPEEAAAVGLATRVWQDASLANAAAWAARKLAAAGVPEEPAPALPAGLTPQLTASDPAFPLLREALGQRRKVRFDYRPADGSPPATRRVAPWGLVWRLGRWYLVGHDLDRSAPRAFRLSRISGQPRFDGPSGAVTVPAGVDVSSLVAARAEPRASARIRVRPGRAIELRRQAEAVTARSDGYDELVVGYDEPASFAGSLAGYGADVAVLEPPELRQAVIDHLRGLL